MPANRAIVAHLVEEVWNEGRFGELKDLVAPNLTLHDSSSGENIAGIDGLKKWITELRSAFPDLRVSSEETISEGESLAQRWSLKGTHKGPYMGVRGTGKPVSIAGFSMYRFRNGKIADIDVTFDRLRILEQIGADIELQSKA